MTKVCIHSGSWSPFISTLLLHSLFANSRPAIMHQSFSFKKIRYLRRGWERQEGFTKYSVGTSVSRAYLRGGDGWDQQIAENKSRPSREERMGEESL